MEVEYKFDNSINLKGILLDELKEYDLVIPENQVDIFVLERSIAESWQHISMHPEVDLAWGYCSNEQLQMKLLKILKLDTFPAGIVTQKKNVTNVDIDMNEKTEIILGAFLRNEALVCKDIFEFVFSEVQRRIERSNQIKQDNNFRETLKFALQEKWIFQRKYIDYYIRKYKLPDVDILTELSACFYEGSENESRVYFTMDGMKQVEELVSTKQEEREICSKKLRMIRKLMEISKQDKIYLYAEERTISDKKGIVITSLVRPKKHRIGYREKGKYIKFMGFLHWSVICDGRETIGYYQGQYKINNTKII